MQSPPPIPPIPGVAPPGHMMPPLPPGPPGMFPPFLPVARPPFPGSMPVGPMPPNPLADPLGWASGKGVSGYNWWEYSSETKLDPKIAGLGYQLASYLIHDRLGPAMDTLKDLKIKFFDWTGDGVILSLFEALGLKLEVVKPAEIPFVLSSPLKNTQLLIFNGLITPHGKEAFTSLSTFLSEGGHLICFFCSAHVLSHIFESRVQQQLHSTTVSAHMRVVAEKELFSAFPENAELELEIFRPPMAVPDEREAQVLVKVAARTMEPILTKISIGSGQIYLFTSKLFLTPKQVEPLQPKWKEKPKPKDPAKKRKKKKRIKRERLPDRIIDFDAFAGWLRERSATPETVAAWHCAIKVGHTEAFSLGLRSFPALEMLAKILLREYQAIRKLEQSDVNMSEPLDLEQGSEMATEGNSPTSE